MKTIIDYLSPEAKELLKKYSNRNVGVICVSKENLPSLFSESSKYGRYFIREYMNDSLLKTYLFIINGDTSDSGNLLGFLRAASTKYSTDSFIYKNYDQIEFIEFKNKETNNSTQYDYTKAVVKLSTIRSFHSRFTKEW